MRRMLHATSLLLTDHQQGTHALDHHVVVLRMSRDRLCEMTSVPAVEVAEKLGTLVRSAFFWS